jgi:hypothetical protein
MTTIDLLIAASGLVALAILAAAALHMWAGWLALKMRELELRAPARQGSAEIEGGAREGMARIELADLKERIRKLEAIANGVDL